MWCPRGALPSNQTYISRCLGNYEPYISLCLLNYDALHLTNFVGGAPVCTELDNEELCSQSHSVGNHIVHSHIASAALEIKQIADVVFVHNHIEVGNTWSALILEAAEPRAQPNIFLMKRDVDCIYVT